MCDKLFDKLKISDPLLDIAKQLEDVAATDEYSIEHHFYSGIVLRAMGIPTNMFTMMFAIGRLPGWIAQWKESLDDSNWRLSRPRQIDTGLGETRHPPIDRR